MRSCFITNMGFCLLCNVESVVLRLLKEGGQKPKAGNSAPELWIIIEPLAPGNSDRQDPIQKEISPGRSLEGLVLKLKLQYLATSCEELTHLKRP